MKETQRLENNAREAKIAADAVAKYKESVLLEQQLAVADEETSRQTLADNAKKAQTAMSAWATQEAINKKAADFYFQFGQNPLAQLETVPVLTETPSTRVHLHKIRFGINHVLIQQWVHHNTLR